MIIARYAAVASGWELQTCSTKTPGSTGFRLRTHATVGMSAGIKNWDWLPSTCVEFHQLVGFESQLKRSIDSRCFRFQPVVINFAAPSDEQWPLTSPLLLLSNLPQDGYQTHDFCSWVCFIEDYKCIFPDHKENVSLTLLLTLARRLLRFLSTKQGITHDNPTYIIFT